MSLPTSLTRWPHGWTKPPQAISDSLWVDGTAATGINAEAVTMPPVMRLPRMCQHQIPAEACRDCRHQCNPPALQVAYGNLLAWHHSAGDRWRCPTCRKRWTVQPSPLRLGGRPLPGLGWCYTPWRARLLAWLGR